MIGHPPTGPKKTDAKVTSLQGADLSIEASQIDSSLSVATEEANFRDLVGPLPASEGMHGLFPYPARIIRQIPRFLLKDPSVTSGIGRVIDPFCGSGTILHEAQIAGLDSVGIEQNPVAALVSRVKVNPPDPEEFRKAAGEVLSSAKRRRDVRILPEDVGSWFGTGDLSRLMRLRESIWDREGKSEVKDALLVALAL